MKKYVILVTLAACVIMPGLTMGQDDASVPPTKKTVPCSEPEARQFDFWIGQWEVISNGEVAGHSRITRVHGNCTILEDYDTAPGSYEGKSFNYYDARDASWHQVWVDNSGLRLNLRGGYADKKMILSAARIGAATATIDRISWTDNDDGTVRQQWDVSQDDGATWQNVFDGLYRPITSSED